MFHIREDYMDKLGYREKLEGLIADGKLRYIDVIRFLNYPKSDPSKVKDPRWKSH